MRRIRQDFGVLCGFGLIVAGVALWSIPAGVIVTGCLTAAVAIVRQIVAMRNETGEV